MSSNIRQVTIFSIANVENLKIIESEEKHEKTGENSTFEKINATNELKLLYVLFKCKSVPAPCSCM